MDVPDRLTSVGAHVEDGSIPRVGDPFLAGDLGRGEMERPQDPSMLVAGLVQGREVLPGDDQDVDRRLRMNVPERHHLLILVDEHRRDLSFGDLAEQAVGVGHGALRVSGPETLPIMLAGAVTRNVSSQHWSVVPSRHGAAPWGVAPCGSQIVSSDPSGGIVESILEAAEAALRQDGGPALKLSELLGLVRARTRQPGLRAEDLRRILESSPHRFRVLDPWRGPWSHLEPGSLPARDPWVLVVGDPGGDDAHGTTALEHRLSASVRWLGLAVDPSSPREVSRWHCLALAERRTRRQLDTAA